MARATYERPAGSTSPSRVRWSGVLAGAVIGIALLVILATLWGALAYGTGVAAVQANLAWFVGASAIVATFAGGLAAGWLSGVPGAGVGAINGLTVWALTLVVSLLVGVPGLVGAFTQQRLDLAAGSAGEALWAAFLALVAGAAAAGVGGALGGALTRPALPAPAPHPADSPRPPDQPPSAHQPVPPAERPARGPAGDTDDRWSYIESDLR